MEFEQVLGKRRMVREFDNNKQIPNKIIRKLLRNAQRAPSAGHTQVQEFIIVKDPTIKKELREVAVDQGRRGREFYSVIDGAFASMLILLTAVNERIDAGFVGAFEDESVRNTQVTKIC